MGCCDSKGDTPSSAKLDSTTQKSLINRKPQRVRRNRTATGKTPGSSKKLTIKGEPALDISLGNYIQVYEGEIEKKYRVKKVLHQGKFGDSWLAMLLSGELIRVITEIDLAALGTKKSSETVLKELERIKNIDHPNIIKVYEFIKNFNAVYIVTEYFEGDSLKIKMQQDHLISEDNTRFCIKTILGVLNYCHGSGVIHGNLKPKNILLDGKKMINSTLKLTNFGFSWNRISRSSKLKSVNIIQICYAAPESFQGETNSPSIDIWSLGVILYLMLTKSLPFVAENTEKLIQKMQQGLILDEFVFFGNSKEVQDLLLKMLAVDPQQRISASDALKHPWFALQNDQTSTIKFKKESLAWFSHFHVIYIQSRSRIQKIILSCAISQMPNLSEEVELRSLFEALDKDHSGTIQIKECIDGYKLFGFDDINEIKELFQKFRISENEEMNFSIFLAGFTDWNNPTEIKKLEKLFLLYDADKSGSLSFGELSKAIPGIRENELKEYFKVADLNKNRKIDIKEFVCSLNSKASINT